MPPIKKSASDFQAKEHQLYTTLRAWYISPGIQRELRTEENDAVRTVLEVLERRLKSAQKNS